MKAVFSRLTLNRLAWACVVALCVWCLWSVARLTLLDPHMLYWNEWSYSEWLINYQGGFVRRGLAGELLRQTTSGALVVPVNVLVFGLFAVFAVGLPWLVKKATGNGLLALLVYLSPVGPFTFVTHNTFYERKEMLFYPVLLALALVCLRAGHKPLSRAAGMGVAFFCMGAGALLTLAHESFPFLGGAPMLWLMLSALERSGVPLGWRRVAGVGLVAVLGGVFLLVSRFHGNAFVAQAIWQSLSAQDHAFIAHSFLPGSAIRAIGWGVGEGVQQTLTRMANTWPIWVIPGAVIVSGTLLLAGFTRACQPGGLGWSNGRRLLVLYALCMLAAAPLYVIGIDWGRWLVASHVGFLVAFWGSMGAGPRVAMSGRRLAGWLAVAVPVVWFGLSLHITECCLEAYPQPFRPFLMSE